MITTIDINRILFRILNQAKAELKLSGGIYKNDDRQVNSVLEDITINTIDLSVDYAPQIATSNVNVHVPDIEVVIDGTPQRKTNEPRLKELSDIVIRLINGTHIPGAGHRTGSQTLLKDADASFQHYVNIRVNWSIHEE